MEAAVASGSKLIIANDPDADRLAAAEQDDAGSWTVFSGNELGVLLGHWAITCHQKGVTNSSTGSVSDNTTKAAILASIVSSRMLKHIATKEGLLYYDTLTGFKWLGNRAVELRATGVPVLFSYEEALGYCVGDIICDKDGLSAAAHFVEMTHHLYSQGLTILQHYRQLEAKYGVFVSYNSYVICYDNKTTDAIFARLRSGGSTGSYCTSCCNCAITAIKDVTLGYDSTTFDHKSTLPVTADSHMIMFEFENSVTVTLRTSGTEPKIKFYTEIAGRPGQQRQELEPLLHTFVNALVNEMLQPDLHGLVRA